MSIFPLTKAIGSDLSTSDLNPYAVNSPNLVGRLASDTIETKFSFAILYAIISSIETIGRLYFSETFFRSSIRAIVPSSFITSHMTAAGLFPDNFTKSTDPSV